MSRERFHSLVRELSDWFERPFRELPRPLKKRWERNVGLPWDDPPLPTGPRGNLLTPREVRVLLAEQWDRENAPANRSEQHHAFRQFSPLYKDYPDFYQFVMARLATARSSARRQARRVKKLEIEPRKTRERLDSGRKDANRIKNETSMRRMGIVRRYVLDLRAGKAPNSDRMSTWRTTNFARHLSGVRFSDQVTNTTFSFTESYLKRRVLVGLFNPRPKR